MSHEPTVRIVPGADTAVLLLHGICGTPDHFRALLPLEAQIPREWSVYNILLDGHCKQVEDFGRSSMKKWQDQVRSVFDELCRTHERVVLVGHSMGTLLSVQLALEHPERIPFLFLIAVPIPVRLRLWGIRNILRFPFGRLDASDPYQAALSKATGMTTSKKLWKYVPWAPRMLELLGQCDATRRCLSGLRVPCIAWQSERDELVSSRSVSVLRQSGTVQVHELKSSTHFYYAPEDAEAVLQSFREACRTYCP